MIFDAHINNFKVLLQAAKDNNIALMECTDSLLGRPVYVICVMQPEPDDKTLFIPIAKLFDGSPYDELDPPVV